MMRRRWRAPVRQLLWGTFAVFVLTALAVSCTAQKEPIDRSLLTGSPCAPPCWQGIVPGQTTRAQALQILESSPYVWQASIREAGTEKWGGAVWHWNVGMPWFQPSISWQDGVVQEVLIGLNYELTVEEVVARFGPPEAVHASEGGVPEHWYWIIDLYYPQRGVEFTGVTQEYISSFEPSTLVRAAQLFAPKTLPERISQEYGGVSSSVLSHIREWKGYGDLRESYGLP